MPLPTADVKKAAEKFFKKLFKNLLTNTTRCDIISKSSGTRQVREHSSAGRASALQAEGHRFEPCCSHHSYGPVVQLVRTLACHARGQGFESPSGRHFLKKKKTFFASVAQLVEQGTENPRVVGSIPIGGTIYADLAHLVERNLAKVEVAGSSPVIRSKEPHRDMRLKKYPAS